MNTDRELLYLPCFQVRYNSVVLWQQWQGPRPAQGAKDEEDTRIKGAYSGEMTKGSRKRIRRAIDLFLQLHDRRYVINPATGKRFLFQLAFVTLTVSDQQIRKPKEVYKECLTKFIRWLNYQKVTWIWKAEFQERQQVHFHIIINKVIHYQDVQNAWNNIQRKAGYLDSYAKANGHFKPNSTDIHNVSNVRDIEAYLVKYLVKNSANNPQGSTAQSTPTQPTTNKDYQIAKTWDCSKALGSIKPFQSEDDSNIWNEAGKYGNQKSLDQCGIVTNVKPESYLSASQLKKYRKWKKESQSLLIN